MKSMNKTINNETQNRTEENKIREKLNNSIIRDKIINQYKYRTNYNPIRILNKYSTFQIKQKNEVNSYKINNKMKQFYNERNSNFIPFNLKKSKNSNIQENNEQRDNLILQLYHTTMDMNQIDKEIRELQNLFHHEEKENLASKFIINKILNENQDVKVVYNFDSPRETKKESFDEENNINDKKNSTIKIRSVKKELLNKNYNILEKSKNRTIPNSVKRIKTRNSKSKIGTLKKELDFYQRQIESKEEKLKNFKKKEGTKIYKGINLMIDKQNKNFKNLSKIGNEMINKVFETDEKIFELNQKLYKLREKTNKYIEVIEIYKTKINEIEFQINNLSTMKIKKEKEEQEQDLQKSKEESELNSLLNEEKILEEKYDKKIELKFEQNDYKKELENSYRDEKKYKLKNEVNLLKLKYCQKKNEELNQKIEEYEKERNDLLEQSKVPRRNKIKIEEMENELFKLEEEIEYYDKQLNNINQQIKEKNKINEKSNKEKLSQ